MIERQYIINLRKGTMTASRGRRAKKAMFVLRAFLEKHMKSDNIKISEQLNEQIWQNGMKNPTLRVKTIVIKQDDGLVHARLFGEDAPKFEEKKAPKTEPTTQMERIREKLEKAAPKSVKKADAKKEEVKTEPKKETPKAEEPVEKKPEATKVEKETPKAEAKPAEKPAEPSKPAPKKE